MGTFKDTQELQKVFDLFIREVLSHPLIGPKLGRSKMVVQFQYTEPNAQITINLKDPSSEKDLAGSFTWGETSLEPDVIFIQSADFSNRIYLGQSKPSFPAPNPIHRSAK